MNVRGDGLLFEQLFMRANITLSATVILFVFPFSIFWIPSLLGGLLHYIISF